MTKPAPRPDWPNDREPINGGLLVVQLAALLVLLGIALIGCGAVWWLAVIMERW